MKYSRALVTGGAGFIGSHVVDKLLARGIETVVLDDLSVGKPENVPLGAEFVLGNICDETTVREVLRGADVVFHLAARVTIRDSFNGFVDDVRTNVMGTVTLLKQIEGTSVKKLIYASSMAVYGNAKYLPIGESHPLDPTSPYGVSKLASEKYVFSFCNYLGIKPVILRYFNTYGPRQTYTPYVGVITIFIKKLLNKEVLPIFGDGMQVRDFVSVEDVVDGTCLAMDYDGPMKIFNIGSGVGTDVNTIAELLKNKMDKNAKVEYLQKQAGEPSDSVADITLARDELVFSPRWTLEDKLQEIIEWNRAKTKE